RHHSQWKLYRADRRNRIRLCQQQYGSCRRDSWADQSGPRRARKSVRKTRGRLLRAAQACGFGQKINYPRVHRLPRRRQEIQIAEAAFAYPIQHDTRAISRKMGSECRLPDGRAKLRRGPLTARETNGAWATAAPACKVAPGWRLVP